uniref:Acidic protein n=1 Tax=Leersia perrieri TaxID=77586 RepID=A0A0D9VBY1_9ORYZ
MEGRKGVAATAAVCIMLILLSSGQIQQACAKSAISRCYDDCVPDCAREKIRIFCKVFCFTCCIAKPNCTGGREATAASAFAGDGFTKIGEYKIDAHLITGDAGPTDADSADCVDGCNNN